MTIEFNLTKGKRTIIDDEDKDLMKYCWIASFSNLWYAQRCVSYISENGEKHNRNFKLHRLILGRVLGHTLKTSEHVDHINGNSLDNRRENLRIATASQNTRNCRKRSIERGNPSSSKFKGVTWRAWTSRGKTYETGKWRVKIRLGGKPFHLGYFSDEIEAARAYDRAALEHFGEFARTNFDKEDYR